MTSVHTDSDLVPLRQFLKTLEAEAEIAVGGIDPNTREIEILKREIAYLERVQRDGPDDRSKEILLQIAIDYGCFATGGLIPAVDSNDRVADLGRDPLAHDHRADNDQQNQRDLCPVELRDRGVELKSDAACTDQAENR